MESEYSIEEIEEMRQYVIKCRDKCLGPETDYDIEGAVTLSRTTTLLAEVLKDQKSKNIASKTR